MAEWTHPDELDRAAASGYPKDPSGQASPTEVAQALNKVLVTGGLRRVPRNPRHRSIVLAMLCLDLGRRRPYTEQHVNARLTQALAAMNATVDHVTCRRYLVDLGFLRRDRSGARYLLNYPKLETVLSPEAASGARALIRDALLASRGGR